MMGTSSRLCTINANTPLTKVHYMRRQLRTFARVSSDVTTQASTFEQNLGDGFLDEQSGPSAPPNNYVD